MESSSDWKEVSYTTAVFTPALVLLNDSIVTALG